MTQNNSLFYFEHPFNTGLYHVNNDSHGVRAYGQLRAW